MNKLNQCTCLFSSGLTLLASKLGTIAAPVYILMFLSTVDYITDMTATRFRGQALSSAVGFKTIAKKLCVLCLVMLSIIVDWLLKFAASSTGIDIPINFTVAYFAAIWLICNELISILENIRDIGAPLPPLLMNITDIVKSKTENISNNDRE